VPFGGEQRPAGTHAGLHAADGTRRPCNALASPVWCDSPAGTAPSRLEAAVSSVDAEALCVALLLAVLVTRSRGHADGPRRWQRSRRRCWSWP
jgi:hypothetical protein